MKAHLQPPPGFRDLSLFLDIINDQKKYKSIVKELDGRIKDVNDGIDREISLSAAESLKKSAESMSLQAKIKLDNADKESEALVSSAKEEAKKIQETFDDKCKKIEEEQSSTTKELSDKHKELSSKAIGLKNLAVKLVQREDSVSAREVAVSKREEVIKEKAKLLSATVSKIG